MTLVIGDNPVPLRIDEDGVARVGDTRVPLDIIVDAFQDGASAEEIVIHYPTLRLTDVYSIITYYLHHQIEVDAYLENERELDEQARQEIESGPDMTAIRRRLLARQTAQGS